MKYVDDWYIIDEDVEMIVGTFKGSEEEAVKWYEWAKSEREPLTNAYWNTWTLCRRYTA